MLRRPIVLICTALMLASHASAGAWLREQGTGFLSYSGVYKDNGQLDGTLYAEYGLRPKLTLGLKIDVDMTSGRMGDGTGFLFARKPIKTEKRNYKLAYELGIGSTFGSVETPLIRTGLSYGRGVTLWDKNGWLAIDGAYEIAMDDGEDTAKLDTTFGLSLNDRFKVMMQVFVSQTESTVSTTLAPSVIWQPKPDAPSYQLGIEEQNGTFAIKLGMWRSF